MNTKNLLHRSHQNRRVDTHELNNISMHHQAKSLTRRAASLILAEERGLVAKVWTKMAESTQQLSDGVAQSTNLLTSCACEINYFFAVLYFAQLA